MRERLNWEKHKVGTILKLEYGKPLPDEKRISDGNFPVYGANGLKGKSNEYYCDKKSIVVGRKGSAGEINLTEDKFWPLDVTYFVTFDEKKYNLFFLFYLLSTLDLPDLAKGIKPGLNRNEVYDLEVFMPLLHEQIIIADFLLNKCEKIDTIIALEEIIISELNEYKDQLAVKCTTKGIRKTKLKQSNIDWVGEMPEHWKVLPLFAVFNEHKCKNYNMQEGNLLSLSYGKIIRKDINTDEGLLPDNFEGYNIVEKGDIVLRLTDMQNDQRSLRTGLVRERGIITSAYVTLRNKINAYPDYLRYLLHSSDICKIIYNFGSGIRQNLTFDGLKRMPLVLPPKDEQKEIAEYLDKKFKVVDNLITLKQQKITELKEYKKSLICEYVTGKKEVPA